MMVAMTPARRRWLRWALLALLAALALGWALRPRPLPVETARLENGPFEQVLERDGRLRVLHRHVVSAPGPAELLRPTLRVGDRVVAGDPVLELQPVSPSLIDARTRAMLAARLGEAEAAQAAAQARRDQARTALAQAAADVARNQRLATEGFVADSLREQSERAQQAQQDALASADADLRASGFMVREARSALQQAAGNAPSQGRTILRAPINGDVLKLHRESGGPVALGEPLLEIGDTRQLEAVIEVLSSEATPLRAGMPVRLDPGGGMSPMDAAIERIEPVAFTKLSTLGVEEQRVLVRARLLQAPPATVGDGYRVDARIVLRREASVPRLPVGTLLRDGNAWAVMVIRQGRAQRQPVQLRERSGDWVWVDSGLSEQDEVILYPGALITPGQRVEPR